VRGRWEAQQELWRAEEAERRRIKNTKESREELFAIIDEWDLTRRIERFFDGAAQRAAALDDEERSAVLDRLDTAG
jgi:hypothetical protein